MENQWSGKRVAFLGDSITDKCHVGTAKNYWQFLEEYLNIVPLVYGINGWRWNGARKQAEKLKAEQGSDVDAILIFMGTNDYNGGVPLGKWYDVHREEVNSHGQVLTLPRRSFSLDLNTVRGCINDAMLYIKENFPLQQVILLTPIHRACAAFGGTNIQPEESFPNDRELYVEEYVQVIREAGSVWSVPVIDLFSLSGLFPVLNSYGQFFHDPETDRLHPNSAGHDRIARTLMYQFLTLPAGFR